MRKTTKYQDNERRWKLTVTTKGLMELLECGRDTAVKIGVEAQARIQIGKRVLWNVEKVQSYLNDISSGENYE